MTQRISSWKTQSETSNTKPISTIVEIESNGVTLKQNDEKHTQKKYSNTTYFLKRKLKQTLPLKQLLWW
jgi:spore germination protein GerM